MKRVIILAVLVAWMVNCGIMPGPWIIEPARQPVFIHECVGDDIDDVERQQYALFPSIDGFVKAALYVHSREVFEWEILTEDAKLMAFNEDPLAVVILADFIERYDEIVESSLEFEGAWDIVDYDVLRLPITKKEVDRLNEQLKSERGQLFVLSSGTGCCLGGLLGGLIGANSSARSSLVNASPRDTTYWPWPIDFDINIPGKEIAIGAAVGTAVFGGLTWLLTKSYVGEALEAIKEKRKPRVVE